MNILDRSGKHINRMKNNEDKNMVQRVRKTVRRMLSEAREVIKIRAKVPSLVHNHPFLYQMSPLTFVEPNVHPAERHRKIRAKERPYSLILEEGSLLRGSRNKSEHKDESDEGKGKQISINQFLNKDEAELVEGYSENKLKASQHHTALPAIGKKRQRRSHTEAGPTYLLTISSEALGKLSGSSLKGKISFNAPTNLLPLKESRFKTLRLDPLSLQKVKKKQKSNYLECCDAWNSINDEEDTFFI